MMETGDALLCIKKLDAVAACLPEELSFTLDHEPMNHPEIVQIIRAAAAAKHSRNYHHGMTTGIGLMRRNDRETVLRFFFRRTRKASPPSSANCSRAISAV